MASHNPLHHLGRDIRILSALIDALIAGIAAGGALYEWKIYGAVLSAIRQEGKRKSVASTERDRRAMAGWGAKDQEGIYRAAGLSDKQTEVARWHFDLGLMPSDMARYFGNTDDPEERGRLAVRYGAHLQEVREKLAALGRRTES